MFELRMSTNTRRTSTNYIKSAAVVHLSTLKSERVANVWNHLPSDVVNFYQHFIIARQHTDARYSKSVCLSVRPSVTFRYHMKTA